jgi:hypothetical protein
LPATAPGHELDVIRDHLVFASFLAVRRFPTAPLQAPFNHGQISFTEIFARNFCLPAKTRDIYEHHLLALFFSLPVTPVHGQTE